MKSLRMVPFLNNNIHYNNFNRINSTVPSSSYHSYNHHHHHCQQHHHLSSSSSSICCTLIATAATATATATATVQLAHPIHSVVPVRYNTCSSSDSPFNLPVVMNEGNDCKCHRLVISLNKVLGNEDLERQFRKALLSITDEECEKVARFRYKDDALASLLGRLFLRQGTRRLASVEWNEIEFGRTEKGKPYLAKPANVKFGINISHQGDYVAFASSCTDKVGVDCMRLDKDRNNKTADEYINSMARSASSQELQTMRSQATEQMKMTYFYRYWCLKEAILKATGEGLLSDLSRLDFRVDPTERYKPRCYLTSTKVALDGIPQDQWVFEESFIDDRHAVAVCREKKLPQTCAFYSDAQRRLFFGRVDMDFLLEGATVINSIPDDGAKQWQIFSAKPRKNF